MTTSEHILHTLNVITTKLDNGVSITPAEWRILQITDCDRLRNPVTVWPDGNGNFYFSFNKA